METYLIYIGKAALAAGAFYLVFRTLFQNRKQFAFNRIYLPVSLALSFIIPLITFTTVNYVEPVTVESTPLPVFTESLEPVVGQQSGSQFIWEWYHYLFAIYAAGTLLFLFRLLLGHGKAWNIIRNSRVQELFNNLVNISKKDIHPFSFFNKIVLSENTLSHPHLEIIVAHERIHVKEKHTLDILFTEILFLLQWFNPFAWLLKDEVKNNLEYKTDHEIAKTTDAQTYQLAMLALADKQGVAPFLTALNGSQLRNRIIMMKKKSANKYAWLKQLVVLPLLAVLVMGLAEREVRTEFVQADNQNDLAASQKWIKGKVINEKGEPVEGAVIQLEGTDIKTTSNSDGTLELETEKMPVTIIISKENYDTCYITLEEVYQFKIILTQDGITRRFKCTSNPTPKLITPNSSEINDLDEFYNTIINEPLVYSQVEEMPEFPGGDLALQKFIKNSMGYPKSEKNKDIEGTVYVTFIIDKEGNVTNAKVAGEEESLYEEALRIINSFPRWKPGKQDGKPVNVRVTLPVKLDLDELENNKQNALNVNSNLADKKQPKFDFSKLKIVVDGKKIPTDSPELKGIKITEENLHNSKYVTEIVKALNIDLDDITRSKSSGNPNDPFVYIRTKNYVPGTNPEFERQTEIPEFIKEKIHSKKNSPEVNSQNTIKGKVTNEKGEPISGALIFIKETLQNDAYGAATNDKGEFSFHRDLTDKTLVFQAFGHITEELHVGDNNNLNVQLQKQPNKFDGDYRHFPDNKSRLADKVNGIQLKNPSDSAKNSLYIIDGMESESMDAIEPKNIVSVTVLKEESATALYGQRGKDGVIIITTKQGAPENKLITELQLRKFIAEHIKYPVEAQRSGIIGDVSIIIDPGKSNQIVARENYSWKDVHELGWVVATGSGGDTSPSDNPEKDSPLLFSEVERVLQMLPEVDIPTIDKKLIRVNVEFQLQRGE